MYLTVHALTGALIGKEIASPLLSFILGFFSHFILDMIPHAEPDLWEDKNNLVVSKKRIRKFMGIAFIDSSIVAVSLATILAIFYSQHLTLNYQSIIAGVAGSVLPDFLCGFFLLLKFKFLKKFFHFHHYLHFSPKKNYLSLTYGTLTQIITAIITINFLF